MRVKIVFSYLLMITLAIISAFSEMSHGSALNLTVATSKPAYNILEKALITGNLTLDGSPVSDALVAVEIDNPKNEIFAIRTLGTGSNITGPWNVEILELIPCDSTGKSKYIFPPGGNAGFKITVKNNMANSYNVIISLSLFYANSAPFATFIPFTGSLDPGQTITIINWPIPIPSNAVVGEAMVFANAYDKLPKEGGFPYCLEKSAIFNITSGGSGSSIDKDLVAEEKPPEGSYSLTIAFPSLTTPLGNYTIYALTYHSPQVASNKITFELELTGDLYPDGKIDMRDIAIVAKAFGTVPGEPNWNPKADLNSDNKVDMKDIAIVAKLFGMHE